MGCAKGNCIAQSLRSSGDVEGVGFHKLKLLGVDALLSEEFKCMTMTRIIRRVAA